MLPCQVLRHVYTLHVSFTQVIDIQRFSVYTVKLLLNWPNSNYCMLQLVGLIMNVPSTLLSLFLPDVGTLYVF